MEPARLIAALVLCAFAAAQEATPPRAGHAALKEAERVFALGNPEQARVEVERAIAEMLAARPEAQDQDDDRALRDAGALAYKLRSMAPARRAWDAVRRYREKTLPPDALELQNARGNVSWIGEQMGLVAEARVLEEQILASLERSQPADSDALATARGNLGDTLLQLGEPKRALELFTKVAEVRRIKLAANHPQRLRTELDLACGLLATGEAVAAERIFEDVLAAAAADAIFVRLRAASSLVMSLAARSDPTPGLDRSALSAAIATLDGEVRAAARTTDGLEWRAAEIRSAELRPFVDVLISAHFGFGRIPAQELRRPPPTTGSTPPLASAVEFHRWERSRLEGEGSDRRVLADERLAALAPGVGWIDLGALADARRIVQAWSDAAERGDALAEGRDVTRALFAPVAAAVGNPAVLAIVPDDVIWAVPLHALELRQDDGSAVSVEAALPGNAIVLPELRRPSVGPWVVFGEPRPELPEHHDRLHAGGAARAFVSEQPQAHGAAATAWRRRLGRGADEHPDSGGDSFRDVVFRQRVLATSPLWAAPDEVPCVATARPILASVPLAASLSREDVFGGSSPAELCGVLFTGYGAASWENARRQCALRAADLRSPKTTMQEQSLAFATPPPRANVVLRARDVETLARALADAGFADLCFATQKIRDVERITFPAAIEASIQRATPVPESTTPGPWLRVRAIPR